MMEWERLIREARECLQVSPEATARYIKAKDILLEEVNARMTAHPGISNLTGGNPMSMMRDNHSNHLDFMSTVFEFNSFELLVKTVPWVYRSYHSHGFSFDYFPLELEAWKKAVSQFLSPEAAGEINAVYDWMLKNHERMIELSAFIPDQRETYPELKDERRRFGGGLLAADFPLCMKIADSVLERENGQEALYLGLIQPVMYEIGRLWEQDKISAAEEHMATSMVGRILAGLYARFPVPPANRGKAVVTSAPNEFHELGARILADMLEADGWDIFFLGANTPAEELIKLVKKADPRFLAISATMPFNMDRVAAMISGIRNDPALNSVKILVGGAAFNTDHTLWRRIGADAWAEDPPSAIRQVQSW
ncbi:MAG TPA: cobalamin-dependent protein [Smithellaceae bacterium]|jgi:methanogenic corrinoid protein MtbC1|nr:cobalamin-dependent protein [Smithellaceae bacterium]HOQ72138.1 cobalamin-dependent protein [Smithellaceae bacterium]HPL10499.1 cobalamin-dependent protein [Smithellaceae bacterium]